MTKQIKLVIKIGFSIFVITIFFKCLIFNKIFETRLSTITKREEKPKTMVNYQIFFFILKTMRTLDFNQQKEDKTIKCYIIVWPEYSQNSV